MTPTSTFKLEPDVLADTVPLRRVGTQEVRNLLSFFIVHRKYLNIVVGHGGHYPFSGESGWRLC